MHVLLSRLALLMFAATSLPAFAQEKCVLDGIVSDSITGEALRKATVQLIGGSEYIATTGADGRFHFEGFPAGNYELFGERSGYLKSAYGSRKPEARGTVLHFDSGEKLLQVELKLPPASSITGKVLDENGEPVSGAFITAINPIWMSGHREYRIIEQGTTDETGAYHISLAMGRYFLRAAPQNTSFVTDPGKPEQKLLPALYADSPSIENATAIDLEPAQNLTGVDFHLHTGDVFHVRGRANANGSESLRVRIRSSGSDREVWDFSTTNVGKNGTFDLSGMGSGSYLVQAVDSRGAVAGALPIEVKGGDVRGLVIPLNTAIQVTGAIRMAPEASDVTGVFVFAQSVDDIRSHFASVGANGEFRIEDLKPGPYVLDTRFQNPNDYVASIQYNGEEVLGAPIDFSASGGKLEIFIKKGAGEIEGNVDSGDSQQQPDAGTKPAKAMTAVLISDRPRLDHCGVLFAQADQKGHFSFSAVPPGKYHALASDDVDQGLWPNRDFLSQIQAKGTEIELLEYGKLQIRVPVLADGEVEIAMASLGR